MDRGRRSWADALRGLRVSLVLWVVLGLCSNAGARPLGERWETREYWLHGVLTGVALSGAAAVTGFRGEHGARWDWELGLDRSVRANFNAAAAQTSDVLGVSSFVLPVAAQLARGVDTAFGNAELIYLEAHAANLLLTSVTKEIVRRPRPYTYSAAPDVQGFAESQGSESYVSFFSGHASGAYTAAVAGSLLYSARTREPWTRHALWGAEMLLAGTTAQLRVRAGRHYRTDIWVGSLVGSAIGVALPALHGVSPRIRASELGVAGGALLLTWLGGELLDPCRLLGCAAPDVQQAPTLDRRGADWSLAPWASAHGPGLQLSGYW
jgi:membrane-associated phospholipid phosphatase